jgi:hypothetical protein
MPIERLHLLLREVTALRKRPREMNIFSIGSHGYYENPTSDLLAFFIDPAGPHGLGDLVLSSLSELLPGRPSLLELEEAPKREYQTRNQNRIDILLIGSDWIVVIENKLRHGLLNPFDEYQQSTKEEFPGKHPYFVILAPYDPAEAGWPWISYHDLLAKVRVKLGERVITLGFSKWMILLREFLFHLDDQLDQMGTPMADEEFRFVQDNYSQVVEVMSLHDRYIKRLITVITSAGAQIWGADPARVSRISWGEVGIALRLYPKADREHNSTFLVLPRGGFRIQFYVQTEFRKPYDANRDVYTDGGKFADWVDKRENRWWLFATSPDKPDFDSALNAFRDSLLVLRDNTQ